MLCGYVRSRCILADLLGYIPMVEIYMIKADIVNSWINLSVGFEPEFYYLKIDFCTGELGSKIERNFLQLFSITS